MPQTEVIDLLKRYIFLLNASGIPVKKAFLYGSYSRNEAHENSDFDIMIVSKIFDNADELIKAKAWRLTEQIDLRIEPYTVGLQKFLTDEVSPLLQVIKQKGTEIKL
ncbi:MAG: nucleotidyltransferase domain-containing protein [Bacteroidetes bacterium]|nr:nucleotidyltransferase domain-containing protein [Bacteroidota bacterium]